VAVKLTEGYLAVATKLTEGNLAVLKLSLDQVDLAGTVKLRCGCVECEFEPRVCLCVSVQNQS